MLGYQGVPVLDGLIEVVAGVDVDQGEGHLGGCEGLGGQMHHQNGVLPPAEEEDRPLELGGHLPHQEDGLGL